MATRLIATPTHAHRPQRVSSGASLSSTTLCDKTRPLLFRRPALTENTSYKGKVVFYHQNQNAFLLGQEIGGNPDPRAVNKYNIIGGTCNARETIIQCAARETCEETLGIISRQTLENVLCALPNHCILSYVRNRKEYGKQTKQHIFVFFVPFESVYSANTVSFVQEFYARRKEFVQHKTRFIQKYFSGHSLTPDVCNEIVNVKWFSTKEMSKDNINTFFYNRIQYIECPQYNKSYSFASFANLLFTTPVPHYVVL